MTSIKASPEAASSAIIEIRSRMRALESTVQSLQRSLANVGTGSLGAGGPYIIDLDTQLFMKQSLTGADGVKSLGVLDMVYYESTDTFPHGGVGPTGSLKGFKSRGAGV